MIATTVYPVALTMHRVSAEAAAQALSGLGLSPGIDMDKLWAAADLVDEHIGDEPVAPLAPRIAVRAAQQKLPVGLVAALDQQLRAQAAGDRLDEVLEEVIKVRDEVGSPPLAAPIGQIVASQALINVLTANRYSTMVDELRELVEGRFGRTPGPIAAGLRRAVELRTEESALAEEEPVELDELREEAAGLASSEEELLLLALFGEEAEALLRSIRERSGGEESLAARGVDRARAEKIRDLVRIVQETGIGEITIEEDGMRVSVRRQAEQTAVPIVTTPPAGDAEPAAIAPRDDALVRVESPMVGTFYRAPSPDAAAVRRGGRRGGAGADALHPRGDEADERGEGGDRGGRARDPRRQRRGGRVRPAALRARAGRRPSRSLMFTRVLVANRGEIAVRVIRALHELGAEAVAIYSTADADALHVRMADHAVCVGPPSAAESYLRIPSVIAAAETTGCEAVHPGYGFLAENPSFVEACVDNDLVFVGPPADVMALMGDKISAKQAMRAADVPTVPGPRARRRSRTCAASPPRSASRCS